MCGGSDGGAAGNADVCQLKWTRPQYLQEHVEDTLSAAQNSAIRYTLI